MTYTDDWLQKKAREVINEPPTEVTSSLEPLHSDISFSPIAGNTSFLDRKEGSPPRLQATAPRTRSQSKSEALKRLKAQKQEMASQGQDSGDGLDLSDGGDGDVQFIEAPKADQPRFLTLNRDTQVMPMNPTIPSWLLNSINKKMSL